jgi:glycerophosphoryl diester phosphodiesterase
MIIAHRGASKDAPENTIPAFSLAWEQGADGIECDIHLARDGNIVCIHDRDTERVSNHKLIVRESGMSELRALDVGSNHSIEFKGTVIPTLREVLATVPDEKSIYIEIKCGDEIIPELFQELKNSGIRKQQVRFISFNKNVLYKIKAVDSEYKVSWLCAFNKDKSGQINPSLEEVLETLEFIQADALSSDSAIPESFVKVLHEKSYEWHVWTIDDPETAKEMKALGAESITTNMPGHMRQCLIG